MLHLASFTLGFFVRALNLLLWLAFIFPVVIAIIVLLTYHRLSLPSFIDDHKRSDKLWKMKT